MPLLDPNTREKLKRFRKHRRAWVSLWLLTLIFVVSLFSELIAHGTPWRVRFNGRNHYPRLSRNIIPQDTFLNDGVMTAMNFRQLQRDERFTDNPDNRMWWAPIPYGPRNTLAPDEIDLADELRLRRQRQQRVGAVRVGGDLTVMDGQDAEWFFAGGDPAGRPVPPALQAGLRLRLDNQRAPELTVPDASGRFEWSLSAYEPRPRAPRNVRVLLRERFRAGETPEDSFQPGAGEPYELPDWWATLPAHIQAQALAGIQEARVVPVKPIEYQDPAGHAWRLFFDRETVQFPFRPVRGHPFGLDDSGRDVLVLVLYATRIGLLFGFILVITSMIIGTLMGALQGYFGGWFDLIMQRIIEIYSSIPFLYVMILLAAVYGTSFWLLLFVYAIFNWIGISYYMRAEYLKLRSQPFTEAARALGLPTGRIMWKHILPNSLVPIITFFPFSLVGAIGSLSALDYIGFGLPPGTPSWGDLLRQAQTYRHAWWLITYPSLALFIVILLSVFIGEGLRAAFDPKRETHWEA